MNNNNDKLLEFLYSILGPYRQFAKNEYYFICPFCVRGDSKKKLAINLDGTDTKRFQHWHCWRDDSHKGGNLFTLLKRMSKSQNLIGDLKIILKSYGITYDIENLEPHLFDKKEEERKSIIELPNAFNSFVKVSDSPEYLNAMSYILKRNITGPDIVKNNIGYCESGPFQGYVIIPSYSDDMMLNYFVARRYYPNGMRYKNPNASKNIVFNELHINWNLPIVLCEGVFDALAIKRNAIPLLGKTIQSALRTKIIEKGVSRIYICLDKDALKNTVRYIEEFIKNGIEVYYVDLPGKDPSDIGFETMCNLIKKSSKMDFESLLTMKLSM